MSRKLILIRHGETVANVARRLDTRLPGAALTDKGAEQARVVGELFAATPPVALISSRARRARQTAGYIEAATGVSVQIQDGLHEVQVGELEDRTDDPSHDLFKSVYHQWHLGDLDARMPGGESGYQVLDRLVPVLTELRSKYLDATDGTGDLVVVSHGAAIRLVSAHFAELPDGFAAKNHLDNTERVELAARADGGWTCVRWGQSVAPFESDDVSPVADDPMG